MPRKPKKLRKVKPWIGAKLIDAQGQFMRYLRVPVRLNVSPVPELYSMVRLLGGEAAVLVQSNPVTYKWGGRAPLVKW